MKTDSSTPVTLEILDGATVIRKYSSEDEVFRPSAATNTVPLYWYREPMILAKTAGMHRFTWDVHLQPVDGTNRVGGPTLPIAAIRYNTVPVPSTPWANPGNYTVRLTANGKSYTQPITVKPDPRVKTSAIAMQQVYTQSRAAYDGAVAARMAADQARSLRMQIAQQLPKATGKTAEALTAYDKKLEAIVGVAAGGGGRGRGQGGGAPAGGRGGGAPAAGRGAAPGAAAAPVETLSSASAAQAGVMNLLQAADVPAPAIQLQAIASARAQGTRVMARWTALSSTELAALNAQLTAAGLSPLKK